MARASSTRLAVARCFCPVRHGPVAERGSLSHIYVPHSYAAWRRRALAGWRVAPLLCSGMSIRELQCASDVMMIRPVKFAGNPETLASNSFQSEAPQVAAREVQAAAAREFDGLVEALTRAGVNVHAFADTHEPHTPDSIFPNNWVSFHADGSVVLYPMLAENRRQERRHELLERLSVELGFRVTRILDMTPHERDSKFLEGTGSLVLDRVNRIAYACISPRTDVDVLGCFAQQ